MKNKQDELKTELANQKAVLDGGRNYFFCEHEPEIE